MSQSISISESARRWGVSRSTIQAKLKSGELSSVSKGKVKAGQAKEIDISELLRVFGEPKTESQDSTIHAQEVISMHDAKDKLIQHQQAEIERLAKQVEFLSNQLEKLQMFNLEREQKLLEHQTKSVFRRMFGR